MQLEHLSVEAEVLGPASKLSVRLVEGRRGAPEVPGHPSRVAQLRPETGLEVERRVLELGLLGLALRHGDPEGADDGQEPRIGRPQVRRDSEDGATPLDRLELAQLVDPRLEVGDRFRSPRRSRRCRLVERLELAGRPRRESALDRLVVAPGAGGRQHLVQPPRAGRAAALQVSNHDPQPGAGELARGEGREIRARRVIRPLHPPPPSTSRRLPSSFSCLQTARKA